MGNTTPSKTFKPNRFSVKFLNLLALFLIFSVNYGWGQLSITTPNSTFTQNFDGLPSTGTGLSQSSGIFSSGWSFFETGSNANVTYDTGTGSNTAGNTYSFGVAGTNAVSDRAFGILQSSSLSSILGFKFTNNTGSTVTSLMIGYTGEQWRRATAVDNLAFSYQLSDVALNASSGWTTVAGLAFTTPITGTAAILDGNATSNRTVISPVTISGLNIPNGTTVTLRWVDATGSSSAAMSIDDFTINLVANVMSNASNIISASNETSNISYANYQSSSISATTDAVKVFSFTIQDGGGGADSDLFPTLLSSITFTKGSGNSATNWANTIRKAALFDGSIKVAEVDVTGETIAFTGLSGVNVAADDGGSKTLDLYLTFESAVTDNQQLQFQIANANVSAASSGSSTFSAFTTVSSSITGDANRIEVTASDIIFDQNTSTVALGAVMSPSPTLRAIDANINYDLDYTGAYSVAVSTGSATLDATATTSGNFSTGVATLSNLKFDGAGTANNITVTSGSFTDISSAFDVTNPQPEINIKQAATSIASGGSYGFGNQLSGSSTTAVTFTVENLGTADLNLAGSPKVTISGTNASEFIIDQTTTNATVNAGGTTTFTITFSPTTQGSKTAVISIVNNDLTGSENPYVINLTGTGTISTASDIANTSGYSYTSNIAYASYQTATTLTTENSIGATGITIRDGAGASDADNLGTTLTSISFTTGGSAAIRTAALFDGLTNVSEVAVNGATTISFTGLSLSAADNGTKDLELRVTYMAAVTDNQQITFTVSTATASSVGSGFATANAGGVASSTTSDINRIEVTATQLAFVQQPTNSVVGGNMTPAVTVKAIDANSITDLDFIANVNITSTGTLSSLPQTSASVAGVATFSSLSHSAIGSGLKLTAASSGLTSVESATFNVTVQAAGILLFEENFAATSGVMTSNGWTQIGSTSTSPITTGSSNGLSYSNYGSTGIGNAVIMGAAGGQDIYKTFTIQNPGAGTSTVYYSCLINTSTVATGDYFISLGESSTLGGSATYRARLYAKKNAAADKVIFGISTNGTVTYGVTEYNLGVTLLLVVKHVFTTSTSTSSLFVNPSLTSEPTSADIFDNTASTIGTGLDAIVLRQGGSSSSAGLLVDGIRVATNWGALMGNASYDSNANVVAGNYNSINVMNGSTLTQTGNVVASGLTIENGSSITVNAGKQLTISGILTNNAGNSGFVLKSDATGTATLINSTADVNATVEQYLPQGRNWYVGIPVTTDNETSLTAAGAASVSYWNEAGSAWVNNYTGTLTKGVGYIAVSQSGTNTNNIIFSGTLNSGPVTVTLSRAGSSNIGFNLIANPYPSYLNVMPEINANANMEKTVWYRTKGASYVFETVNTTSGVGTNTSGNGVVTGLIPPMQAFWVRTLTHNNSLTFTNAMRYHANPTINLATVTTTPLKAPKVESVTNKLLRLQVAKGNISDETVLYFNPNATTGYDAYDSQKWSNANVNIPELYTIATGETLAINGLPEVVYNQEIPLGFNTGSQSTFSIKATEMSNFDSSTRFILKDAVASTEYDLTPGQAYEFSSSVMNSTNRFSIIFKSAGQTTGVTNSKLSATSIFINGNKELVVKTNVALSSDARIAIYNSVGQQVDLQPVTGSISISNAARTAGIYWVKLTNDGETITRKVVVN